MFYNFLSYGAILQHSLSLTLAIHLKRTNPKIVTSTFNFLKLLPCLLALALAKIS